MGLTQKTVGFLGGKYLPVHLGHIYMIMEASNQVDKLYVVVSSSPNRDRELCKRDGIKYMPADVRMSWLGKALSDLDNIEVLNVTDNDWDADYNWEKGAQKITEAIPEKITHVFSSEPEYGEHFSKYYPAAKHVVIDSDRKTVGISATQLRKDVYAYWEFLPEPVKSFFVKKVVVVGTESCGKSTLTKKLAKMYGTKYVSEVGRDYCEEYSNHLTADMFDSIAMDHYRKIERMLSKSNKVVFIDSDAIITKYYLGMYMETPLASSEILEAIVDKQKFDLVIYLEPDVAWVDDGIRFAGEQDEREYNNIKLKKMYHQYQLSFTSVSGSYQERFNESQKLVNNMLKKEKVY